MRHASCLFTVLFLFSPLATVRAEFGEDEFKRLRSELTPDSAELWRTIPWRIAVLDGKKAATEAGKPIFIWAMDGHPLGCT